MLRRASLPLAAAVLGLLTTGGPVVAQGSPDARVAIGLHAGSPGVGPDLTFRWTERTHVRLTGGSFSYDTEIETDDLTYDTEADLRTAFLLLDWYPGAGGLRVSVGGGWNGTEAEVSADAFDLVRPLYPSNPAIRLDYGRLEGTAQGQSFVPALLLGWGNPFRGGRWNVSFEVGAFYQGEPEVDLRFAPSDLFFEDGRVPLEVVEAVLRASGQEEELEAELDDYTVVPVVSLGISYRF